MLPSFIRRSSPALFLALFTLLGLPALTHAATTRTVPIPYATIKAAIDASSSGDTVLISNGTYTGPGNVDLSFGGKNITVTSVNGAANTIIDCYDSSGAPHRGFYIYQNETNATISGLTIENGYESGSSGSSSAGGGIYIINTTGGTINVTNCTLTGKYCLLQWRRYVQ